jgi:hypothetical protein
MERTTEMMETMVPKGRTLRIQDGKGLELKVVSGSLWVTYEHDEDDFVVDACDTFRVTRDGLALAHAFKDVRLAIAYPAEAGAPSLTLGGGYREVGSSVVSTIFGEWMRELRGWIVAGVRERAARSGRMWA